MLADDTITGMADAVVAVLGVDEDGDVKKRARTQVQVMVAQVFAYMRGNGFTIDVTDGGPLLPFPDVEAVIISATARWASNPAQSDSESSSAPVLRRTSGGGVMVGEDGTVATESFSFSGFQGFTDLELKILHAYRVRNG